MGYGTDTIDESKAHTVIEVTHPTVIPPLRGAPFSPGTYKFPGDLRGLFRSVRDRRLIAAGVVKLTFNGETPPENVSTWTLDGMESTIVEPTAIDMATSMPDDSMKALVTSLPAPAEESPTVEAETAVEEETPEPHILLREGTLEPTVINKPALAAPPSPKVDHVEPEQPLEEVLASEPAQEPPADVVIPVAPSPVETQLTDSATPIDIGGIFDEQPLPLSSEPEKPVKRRRRKRKDS